ncbi:hypothetical protein [Alkalihalobacterium chitinilyticum]|uniref:DUF4398 domain-containing protein n=1 Tax=Alkalihalobacterium chitinilyticum TaxID=2980103 RepID=A0ABT5VIE9_9BACI|nr:hypothetical protein [Alkalihalobacterium chitinilyticum]MDE5414014.1 hypothetical protein [Alkalihalobacterium chitinilyticum]
MIKRIFIQFIVLLALITLSACSNQEYQKAMDQGIESLAEKDYHKAALYFELALKEKANDEQASAYYEQAKEMANAIEAADQWEFEKAINSLSIVINQKKGLKSLQEEARKLEKQIQSKKQIVSHFEEKLEQVKSLNIEENYHKIKKEIELLEENINSNDILSPYQTEITRLKEQLELFSQEKDEAKQKAEQKKKEEALKQEEAKIEEAAKKQVSYQVYQNARFSFSIQYPSDLTMAPPPTNGDGARFYNNELEIVAFGGHTNVIDSGETIETYYYEDIVNISAPIGYQRLTEDWYVISYNEYGTTIYKKFFFNDSTFNSFIISYPASKQEQYGPVTDHIASTFIEATY